MQGEKALRAPEVRSVSEFLNEAACLQLELSVSAVPSTKITTFKFMHVFGPLEGRKRLGVTPWQRTPDAIAAHGTIFKGFRNYGKLFFFRKHAPEHNQQTQAQTLILTHDPKQWSMVGYMAQWMEYLVVPCPLPHPAGFAMAPARARQGAVPRLWS